MIIGIDIVELFFQSIAAPLRDDRKDRRGCLFDRLRLGARRFAISIRHPAVIVNTLG